MDIRSPLNVFRGKSVIFGGGGLLFEHLTERIRDISEYASSHGNKTVLWGVGSNQHDTTSPTWPAWLDELDLVGIRDRDNPFGVVPCVSCMSPAFNYVSPQWLAENEVIVYEHFDHPIPVAVNAPRMTNDRQRNSFADVIDFIASGKVIITNTYHGAYWGRLLGRKVVVYEPFSSRFFGFDPPAIMCDSTNWETKITEARIVPDYLVTCRRLTVEFAERVRRLI